MLRALTAPGHRDGTTADRFGHDGDVAAIQGRIIYDPTLIQIEHLRGMNGFSLKAFNIDNKNVIVSSMKKLQTGGVLLNLYNPGNKDEIFNLKWPEKYPSLYLSDPFGKIKDLPSSLMI